MIKKLLIAALLVCICLADTPIRSKDSIERPMKVLITTKDALMVPDTICVMQRWETKDGKVRIHPCHGVPYMVDVAIPIDTCNCWE